MFRFTIIILFTRINVVPGIRIEFLTMPRVHIIILNFVALILA